MRYTIMVKKTEDGETSLLPQEKCWLDMHRYRETLLRVGVPGETSELQSRTNRWRIQHSRNKPSFIDDPFAEIKELVFG